MGYSRETVQRITFEEWDEPDFWVDLRRITEMPYAEYLDVWVNKVPNEETGILRKLSAHILAWNITDEEGNILPIPKEDPDSMYKLRMRHAEYISQSLLADSQFMDDLNLLERTRTG